MRNHFVPQFLLAAWAESLPNRQVTEFRIDLPQISCRQRSPKATGFEHDLYSLTAQEVAGMSQHAIEIKFLKLIDNAAARVRRRMTTAGLASLTVKDRCDWVIFLMSLRTRQPEHFKYLTLHASEELRRELAERPEEFLSLRQEGDPDNLEAWVERKWPGFVENFGPSIFHKITNSDSVGNKLFGMKWWLWKFTKQPHDLLLSDNPLIITAHINAPNLIVALPISPRLAFMATSGERTASALKKQTLSGLSKILNERSILQSRARIYSTSDLQSRFIENRLSSRTKKREGSTAP